MLHLFPQSKSDSEFSFFFPSEQIASCVGGATQTRSELQVIDAQSLFEKQCFELAQEEQREPPQSTEIEIEIEIEKEKSD